MIITKNDGFIDYNFTQNIRHAPAHWKHIQTDSIATIQQLGTPTFFLTLSMSETKNTELLKLLYENKYKTMIAIDDVLMLDENIKTELIKNDPYTIVIHFEEVIRNVMQILENKENLGPLCCGLFYETRISNARIYACSYITLS